MELKHITQVILESGMSQKDLADEVGTTQTTIHRALYGSDIRYSVGRKIEQIYEREIVGAAKTSRPSKKSKAK